MHFLPLIRINMQKKYRILLLFFLFERLKVHNDPFIQDVEVEGIRMGCQGNCSHQGLGGKTGQALLLWRETKYYPVIYYATNFNIFISSFALSFESL